MNRLQNFIHKENFTINFHKDFIVQQAMDVLPPRKPKRCTLFQTMRHQFFFLPYYAYLFQIVLVGIQFLLFQQDNNLPLKILFAVMIQLLFTNVLSQRSLLFEMEEIEQVTRTGKKSLVFIRYVLLGCFLYGELLALAVFTLFTDTIVFLKAAILISILYHSLSLFILYITIRFIPRVSLYSMSMLGIAALILGSALLYILYQLSLILLIPISILTLLCFYIYCYITMEKRCLSCN